MKEISNEKVSNLRDIIFRRADEEKKAELDRSTKEAEEWLANEKEKLQRETEVIIADAQKHAEDIRRRQILAAEREKLTETLRLRNRIVSESIGIFKEKLMRLHDRKDYEDILTGICLDAVTSLGKKQPLKVRFAAADAHLAKNVIKSVSELCKGYNLSFDAEPAPIMGGCWVTTQDGRRQATMDWQTITQEKSDLLAERLLEVL